MGLNGSYSDTDGDNLNDYYEISIYNTDPLDEDTDNDGYNDGDEIASGTDPNDPNNYPATSTTAPQISGFELYYVLLLLIIQIGILITIKMKKAMKINIIS